jgi:hypothetical protein
MFKKFLGGDKKPEVKAAPAKVDKSIEYEKTLFNIKVQIEKLDDQMERYD